MSKEKDGRKSFWTTIPGILTGIAAVISALGAFLVAIESSGLAQRSVEAEGSKAPVSEQQFIEAEESEAPASQQPKVSMEQELGKFPPRSQNTTTGDRSPIVNDTTGNVSITIGD